MVNDRPALEATCERLARASRVSIDTEFHTEHRYFPRLMLVQVQPDEGPAELIDPVALDLSPLGEALSGRPLLVHGGASDLQLLQRHAGLRPGPVFDTQIAAAFVGGGWPTRLQDLASRWIGRHLPKTETLTDWGRRPLSDAQREYALDDVRVLPALADALAAAVRQHRREAMLADCTAELCAAALAPPNDDELWRTFPASARLAERERAVFARLVAWREREARSSDVPRGSVLPDGILLDVARRLPTTVEALRGNRRLPKQIPNRLGPTLVRIVAAGEHGPAPAPRPWTREWEELVRVAARVVEARTGVAADLVVTEAVLDDLHTGRRPKGWRDSEMFGDLAAFVEGRIALRLDGRKTVFGDVMSTKA